MGLGAGGAAICSPQGVFPGPRALSGAVDGTRRGARFPLPDPPCD